MSEYYFLVGIDRLLQTRANDLPRGKIGTLYGSRRRDIWASFPLRRNEPDKPDTLWLLQILVVVGSPLLSVVHKFYIETMTTEDLTILPKVTLTRMAGEHARQLQM